MRRSIPWLVRGNTLSSTSLFFRTRRCKMHQPHTQHSTRGKKTIWYPTLRHCDTFVPSAAPDPILTLDRSLHKILKARKCDPIGYLLLIYQSCLPFPSKLEAH
jgi:hypothetical protein